MSKKNTHEKLAQKIQEMMDYIEEHLKNCKVLSDSFYELKTFRCMVTAPLFAAQKRWPLYLLKKVPLTEACSNVFNLEHNRFKILLYCPDQSEISQEIDWYEKEDEKNSLSYQLRCIHEYLRHDSIIKQNLLKKANPIYDQAVMEWKEDPDSTDVPVKKSKKLGDIPFAPREDQIIENAYEVLKTSMRLRRSRHKNSLRMRYRKLLEESIFKGIPQKDPIRKSFLLEWEIRLFPRKRKPQIFPQNTNKLKPRSIDRYTAGHCIIQLVNEFLADPTKTQLGEATCIIWIQIWATRELPFSITIDEIIKLTTQQISPVNTLIRFTEGREIEISSGLHKLLLCLRGRGAGKQKCRLFKNITSIKTLERILHNITKNLGVKLAILPAAFNIPFHSYQNNPMSITQSRSVQNQPNRAPYSSEKIRINIQNFINKHFKIKA